MDRKVTIGNATKASDQNYSIKAVGDAGYTILDTDKYDLVTVAPATARTITLPTVEDNTNRILTIMNINGTDTVTVDGEGAETINGGSVQTLTAIYDFITIVSSGTEWLMLGSQQT